MSVAISHRSRFGGAHRLSALAVLTVTLLGLPGCGKTAEHRSGTAGQGGSDGTGGSQPLAGTAPVAGTTPVVVDPPVCVRDEPTRAPAALLDEAQLSHVAALFEETLGSVEQWPRHRQESGDAVASSAFVERQLELATRIGARMVAEPALFERVVGCDLEQQGAEACLPPLLTFVQNRLFRGLAADGTDAELRAVYERGVELDGDAASGLRAVLEVALQAPELLYRVEVGRPPSEPGGWAEPTPREMASRLSFLYWDRGPDDELLAAADADELREPEQLAEQARRLLRDPRARDVVRRFYEELLSLVPTPRIDPTVSDLTQDVYTAMRGELGAFVEDATFEGAGDFAALFAPVTWLNGSLARFYGLPGASGAAFQKVQLDPKRYAGLVTQGAWLASIGAGYTSPTRRGLILTRALLCREVPPEPPDIVITVPTPSPPPLTTRQRLAEHLASPVCKGCHELMDPYGFALEHFDLSGRWRDTEDGLAIDTAVSLEGQSVDGSAELAAWFLAQPGTRDCFIENWRSFSFGRARVDVNDCEQAELRESFSGAGENVVELLVALTSTDTFRYLGKPQ